MFLRQSMTGNIRIESNRFYIETFGTTFLLAEYKFPCFNLVVDDDTDKINPFDFI